VELAKNNNNRDSLLPLIILHIRQTDIRGPLHRADDSCKHVEVAVSEVDYAYACAPDCCCWPLFCPGWSSARQASARRSFIECVSSQPCGLAQHTRHHTTQAHVRAGQTTTACNQTT
jgi:hypothetical protein